MKFHLLLLALDHERQLRFSRNIMTSKLAWPKILELRSILAAVHEGDTYTTPVPLCPTSLLSTTSFPHFSPCSSIPTNAKLPDSNRTNRSQTSPSNSNLNDHEVTKQFSSEEVVGQGLKRGFVDPRGIEDAQ